MKKLILMSSCVLTGVLFSAAAFATETTAAMTTAIADPAMTGQNCKMVETTSLTANINNMNIDIGNVQKYMDEQMAAIESAAKELDIAKFEKQSSTLNVYSNSYNTGCGQPVAPAQYQLSGSVTYNMDDATKAADLAKKLETKGFNLNLNLNAYRQCQ